MRDFDVGAGVLVALHGHGDDPGSARRWGRRIAPSAWEVVAPGAPRDPDGTRRWFPTGPRGADGDALRRSADRIGRLVSELRADGRPVVVVGFSQGGAMALALATSGVQPDAVVSICGFLADVDDDDWIDQLTAVPGSGPHRPPTLVLSGSQDDAVPAFLGQDAAAVLTGHDRAVTSVVVDGGHEVTAEMSDRARAWIDRVLVRGVRVSLGLPVERVDTGAELVSGEAIADLAALYERSGFHAAFVTDHPAPDDRWLAGGGHHAMEPTVALAIAASSTHRLLLHTNVYVLPYRNPFLAAKALASLDVVSGGRLIAGVAAGYLRPEFEALGVDFDDRTDRLEDALRLLPRIWAESGVSAAGPGYTARSVSAEPRPWHRPHPPIWVGGNSPAALRRAVHHAQGWSPFPTPGGMERGVRTSAITSLSGLAERLVGARELCREVGRTEPLTVCFVPFALADYHQDPDRGLAALFDEVAELEDLGVDWVALSVPGLTRAEIRDRSAELAGALGLG